MLGLAKGPSVEAWKIIRMYSFFWIPKIAIGSAIVRMTKGAKKLRWHKVDFGGLRIDQGTFHNFCHPRSRQDPKLLSPLRRGRRQICQQLIAKYRRRRQLDHFYFSFFHHLNLYLLKVGPKGLASGSGGIFQPFALPTFDPFSYPTRSHAWPSIWFLKMKLRLKFRLKPHDRSNNQEK